MVGSTTIVLHAPQEREIESVKEVWDLATEPGNFASPYLTFSNLSLVSLLPLKVLLAFFVGNYIKH